MDRLLENDLAVKILSLFLAMVLWFQVEKEIPQSQRTIPGVPVQVRQLPAGLEATELNPATVAVVVRGRGRQFNDLSREDMVALVDLSGVGPGRVSYAIDKVTVPKGVTLQNFTPDHVTVDVAQVIEKEVNVSIRLEGEPSTGYLVGPPEVTPRQVLVVGRETEVERVARVEAIISVEGARSIMNLRLPVVLLDGDGAVVSAGLQVTPAEVRVMVPVERVPTEAPDFEPQAPDGPAEATP